MLNLSHPLTKHIFRASALIDGAMVRGQRMTVSPSAVRAELLTECLPLFAEMRELAVAQFPNKAQFIVQAVEEFELGLRALAALDGGQITEDRRDGVGDCPHCRTPVWKVDTLVRGRGGQPHYLILCPECDKLYTDARDRLTSFEGFGTDGI